ncbi:MAG TPA: hypothetical protein P5519_07980 [Spirochaetia bacterium]|nr:hypothetical protein [Spirochaetales bacterium]HRS65815.1 hypothetical protein [Spirochaetia bacterium]HPD79498.1 hypothetical protein [Spirochaetales bacterium]HQG39859.1 hypothetical protein [Spirochaetales bacterium]HQK34094.1 hypothetical protein [Spirochaetales bacterium]
MKKLWIFCIVGCFAAVTVIVSCLSLDTVSVKVQTGNTSVEIATGNSQNTSAGTSKITNEQLEEINTYLIKAQEALDMNHLQEAVKLYISALIRAEKYAVQEKIQEITNILNKVGAKFTIEPGNIWKSNTEKPVTGNCFWAAQAKGIMPALNIYENFGFGKSPLQDVSIRFEFIENNGTLVPTVTTDATGFASTTISGIKDPTRAARIRAYPIVTNEGYTYAFKTVYYDFVYIPTPFVVLVYTMEKVGSSVGSYTRNMETISQTLKTVPLQPVLMQEAVNPNSFLAALQGDVSKIAVSQNVNPDLFALFYIEIKEPYQYSASYKIFLCMGSVTVRILTREGVVLTSLVLTDIKGSGRDGTAAIESCRNEIATALEQRMSQDVQKLYKDIYKQ